MIINIEKSGEDGCNLIISCSDLPNRYANMKKNISMIREYDLCLSFMGIGDE